MLGTAWVSRVGLPCRAGKGGRKALHFLVRTEPCRLLSLLCLLPGSVCGLLTVFLGIHLLVAAFLGPGLGGWRDSKGSLVIF